MNKLKTLKDLTENWKSQELLARDLKSEAIKWIKDDRHCSNLNPCPECKGFINGFKHFFNITEDDLNDNG